MRIINFFIYVALAAATGSALAQMPGPADKPGTAAVAVVGAAHYTTDSTEIGTLLSDPDAKAILVKQIPEIANDPGIEQAAGMTLKGIQPYAADRMSDQALAEIDADFAKIPVKK